MLSRAAMQTPDPVDAIVQAVLAYLARHPQAADSLHGVARWWVGDDGRLGLPLVQQALDRLVVAGELRRQRLADGSVLYARAGTWPRPASRPRRNGTLH
ncbi:MAG: hypothetical protein KF863_00215 [Rubrivivax sp.]|nr:hypothetical protein [Rubrivivax sp.]